MFTLWIYVLCILILLIALGISVTSHQESDDRPQEGADHIGDWVE